jgi:hypothetical protein
MECFIEVFGKAPIKSLTADREFIGKKWLSWLEDQSIPYVIRIKEDGQYISNSKGKMLKINELFRSLPAGDHVMLSKRKIGKEGDLFDVCATRSKKGELAVLIHSKTDNPIETYQQRWHIETMFKAFKTGGFDSESTHIVDDERLNTLMQVMSIAFCLAYQAGEIISADKPPVIKKHGYREKSIFRIGMDEIIMILQNIIIKLERWTELISQIFQKIKMVEKKIVM